MCRLRHNPELSDEHRATGDAQSANDHPWREDVSEDESCKERVPQQRDCAKRSEYHDGEGCDLEDGAKEI